MAVAPVSVVVAPAVRVRTRPAAVRTLATVTASIVSPVVTAALARLTRFSSSSACFVVVVDLLLLFRRRFRLFFAFVLADDRKENELQMF